MTKETMLSRQARRVAAMAPVIQRWAELCKQGATKEPGAALRWYLEGRADAHAMDAARLRECLEPSVARMPPEDGVGFAQAYEGLLEMMQAMGPGAKEEVEE